MSLLALCLETSGRPVSLRIVLTSEGLAEVGSAGCGLRALVMPARGGKRRGERGMDRLLCKSSRLRGSRDRHGSTSSGLPMSYCVRRCVVAPEDLVRLKAFHP